MKEVRLPAEVIARRTQALMNAVELELSEFEEGGWWGERALDAADALAKAEHDSELLRRIGEETGDVDGHNRITAAASTARRTTRAMLDIVNEASIVLGDSSIPLLAAYSGDKELEAAAGARTAYMLIDAMFEQLIEDADSSFETAGRREEAIGLYERDRNVADKAGTVWFAAPAGRIGVTRETLTAEPSARGWGLEFAADLAGIAAHVEGIAEEEELARLRAPMTSQVVSSTVSSIILAQGTVPLERWREAFFEDALGHCYILTGSDNYGREDLADYGGECDEALQHLLDTGREFAAGVTAYAALVHALEDVGLS
ncbi:MAG: hypothetical protein OXU77_17560 [Gammaproteobacteria bacterium]|nr:hypothetical protein [Gammaproteobacteria bacterium]